MNRFQPELTDRISDYSIGNQLYWKTVFNNCLNIASLVTEPWLVNTYVY